MVSYCVSGKFEGNGQQYPCLYDGSGNFTPMTSPSLSCVPGSGCTFLYDSNGNLLSVPIVADLDRIVVPPNLIVTATNSSSETLFEVAGTFVENSNTTQYDGYGDVQLFGNTDTVQDISWTADSTWSRFVNACSFQQIPALMCQQFGSSTFSGLNAPFYNYTGVPNISGDPNRWIVYFLLLVFSIVIIAIVIYAFYASYKRYQRRDKLYDRAQEEGVVVKEGKRETLVRPRETAIKPREASSLSIQKSYESRSPSRAVRPRQNAPLSMSSLEEEPDLVRRPLNPPKLPPREPGRPINRTAKSAIAPRPPTGVRTELPGKQPRFVANPKPVHRAVDFSAAYEPGGVSFEKPPHAVT